VYLFCGEAGVLFEASSAMRGVAFISVLSVIFIPFLLQLRLKFVSVASFAIRVTLPDAKETNFGIESLSVIFLSSKNFFGGHARHILFWDTKRALPFLTRPFARLG